MTHRFWLSHFIAIELVEVDFLSPTGDIQAGTLGIPQAFVRIFDEVEFLKS